MNRGKAPLLEESSSENDVSSVATDWTEESDDEDEYQVDKILAERDGSGGKQYLIKWTGYPIDRSNWEPVENILDRRLIVAWTHNKQLVAKGFRDAFDVEEWEKNQTVIEESRQQRYAKRKAKRRLRGLPRIHAFEDESSSEEEPLADFVVPDQVEGKQSARTNPRKRRSIESSSLVLSGRRSLQSPPLPSGGQQIVGALKSSAQHQPKSSKAQKALPKDSSSSMFAKKTQRPGGAQLLANWKAPLPEKRRRISKKPVKYNASASWGALKAGRDGRIPDAHEIDLIDPSEMGKPEQPNQPQVLQSESAQVQTTGPPAPEAVAPSNSVLPHRLPKDETQTGVRIALTCWGWTTGSCEMAAEKCAFLHKVGPGTASEALYRQFQKHYKGGIQQRKFALRDFVCKYWESGSCFKTITECHAAHFYWTDNVPMAPPPPPAAPSSSDAMDMSSVSGTEEQQYVFKIALTCPGWKQDHCSLGSETCCFLHHDSPRAASAELYRQYLDHEYGHHREPKFEDRTRICKFWQTKKRCVKHDTECTFAHFQWVRTLTAVSSSSLSAARLPPTGPSCVAEPRPASPTGLPPKSMTCFFWYNGGSCKKTEEACWFVHRLLPTIAPDPRRNKDGEPWSHRLSSPIAMSNDISGSLPAQEEPLTETVSFLPFEPPDNAIDVEIQIPGRPEGILARIHGLSDVAKEWVADGFGATPLMNLQCMSSWGSVQKFMLPIAKSSYGAGDVVVNASSIVESDALVDFVEDLVQQNSAAVIRTVSLLLIFYPTQLRESDWAFLESQSPSKPDTILTLEVRNNPHKKLNTIIYTDTNAPFNVEQLFQYKFNIPKEVFFEWSSKPPTVNKNVFLMLGEGRQAEMDLYVRLFREMGAAVWCSTVPGSWKAYRRDSKGQGVIILHPECYQYDRIPRFADFTIMRYNFFQLGADCVDLDRNGVVNISCKRLFHRSQSVWITDDLFEKQPNKALEIVEHLIVKNKNCFKGLEQWRLYARPGVRQWLFELCEAHYEDEHQKGDTTRFKLWNHVNNLVPEDIRYSPVPAPFAPPEAVLMSRPRSHWPEYFEMLGKSQDAANDLLLQAFSLDACVFAQYCRRWVIAHDRDMPQWTQEQQHLKVYTTEKYLQQFSESC